MFIAQWQTNPPKSRIPGGLSVNTWLIEPSTLDNVPGIFDRCVVNLVISDRYRV